MKQDIKIYLLLLAVLLGISCKKEEPEYHDLRKKCHVHTNVELKEGTAVIWHGRRSGPTKPLPDEYYVNERLYFPFACPYVLTTKSSGESSNAEKAKVLYCPECRKARIKYIEELEKKNGEKYFYIKTD